MSEESNMKFKAMTAVIVILMIALGIQTWYIIDTRKQLNDSNTMAQLDDNSKSDWFDRPFDAQLWDPFQEMQEMQDHMNRVFDDAFSRFGQSSQFHDLFQGAKFQSDMTVKNEANQFVITLQIPGGKESDLKIDLQNQQLSISGVVNRETSANGRRESYSSQFSRSITLPEAVQPDSLQSSFNNETLRVVILKQVNDAPSEAVAE